MWFVGFVLGLFSIFNSAILDAWKDRFAASLCAREGVRGGPLLDAAGTLQLLDPSHVRERDKALLRGVPVGGVWNGFLLGGGGVGRGQPVPCQFCGGLEGNGHLFWECTCLLLVEIRGNPEFHDLMRIENGHWPRCLFSHGWLPVLSGVNGHSPWAETAAQGSGHLLESALGSYSSRLLFEWCLPDGFDADDAALRLPGNPHVWTDVSVVLDKVSGPSSSGAGFDAHLSCQAWSHHKWVHFDDDLSTGKDD